MNFTSLDEVLKGNFIKSIPHLTRLDLTANEIKLIELVLSFTRNGNEFYMNYADIAKYLYLGDTKTKAKVVGNIVLSAKAKGYIITDTTHNFNGKNGGSSANLKVNEAFLEGKLHAYFNPVALIAIEDQISTLEEEKTTEQRISPKLQRVPKKTFMEELADLDKEDEANAYDNKESILYDEEIASNDENKAYYQDITDLSEFTTMLKRLIRKESMSNNRLAIQYMIDNPKGWDIKVMKEAFEALV